MVLFRSGLTVAFFTLLSRIFGLFRELFVAAIFGAGNVADSVNVAFKLPNLFRRIFAEGALSAVFIPIFNEKMLQSPAAAKKFSREVFIILILVLSVSVIAMQILMPYIMFIIAPGFHEDKEKFDLTVLLCRITIPYLIFISIVAFFGSILNSLRRFAAFAFVPVLLSVAIIVFTLLLEKGLTAPISISVALLIAGILQLLFMVFCLIQAKFTFSIKLRVEHPYDDLKKVFRNMGPAALGAGSQQLNLFISQAIASFIPGAISILSYADRLYQFPLSLIGITFATILLPELSRIYKTDKPEAAFNVQNQAINFGLLLALPSAFGIILLTKPIIHVIYEHGVFRPEDTEKTAEALAVFALGLPAFIVAKILTTVFYANQDTKTPLKITIYSLAVNIILNIVFMVPLKHVGIALGSSIAGWYNVWLLLKYNKKHYDFVLTRSVKIFIYKTLLSCFTMSLVILIINHYYGAYFYSESVFVKISALAITVFCSVAVFVFMIIALKLHKVLLGHDAKLQN